MISQMTPAGAEPHASARAVDLAEACGSAPAGVICEIMNEDGTMARVPELKKIADQHDLKMILTSAICSLSSISFV